MKILFSVILFLILPVIAYAEPEFVVDAPESVYMALQEAQSCKDITELQVKEIEALKTNIINLEAEVNVCGDQVQTIQETVAEIKAISEKQDTAISELRVVIKEERQNCKDIIEASKPSLFERIKDGVLYFLGGVAVATALILL